MSVLIMPENLGNYVVPEDVYGGVCVDIGSNVGSFLKKYSQHFKVIHYYEPFKECYDICNSLNLPNVVGYNEAVYHTRGIELELIAHNSNCSGSSTIKTDITIETPGWSSGPVIQKIKSVGLQTVITRAGGFVDYMKLDCETGEYNFLYGKDLSKIKYITMEIHFYLGETRWNNLVNHVLKTHELVHGDCVFNGCNHKEPLFKLK